MRNSTLSSKSKISTTLALSIWLLLLSIPLLISYYSLIAFADFSLKNELREIKPKINLEIQKFKEDVMPKVFIENLLNKFDLQFGFKDFSRDKALVEKFEKLDAKILLTELEKFTQLKVAGLFYYGPDTKSISFTQGSHLKNSKIRKPPNILLERFFGLLNNQSTAKILKHKSTSDSLLSYLKQVKKDKAVLDSAFFLKTIFGNIDQIQLKNKKASESISSKIGEIGKTLFYFSEATCTKDGKKSNLGGYLAIIRLKDIPAKLIIKNACRKPFSPLLNRSVINSNVRIEETEIVEQMEALGTDKILEDEEKIHLDAIVPQSFIVFLSQGGLLAPNGLRKLKSNIPLLRVSVNKKDLRPPFYSHLKTIKFIFLLLFILGSVVIFGLSIFGFNFSMPIKGKIMLGICFTLILPVAILFFTGNLYGKFSSSIEKSLLKHTMENKSLEIKKAFSNILRKKEIQNLELGITVQKILKNGNESLQKYFEKWLTRVGADTILFHMANVEKPMIAQSTNPELKGGNATDEPAIIFGSFFLDSMNNKKTDTGSLANKIIGNYRKTQSSQRITLGHIGEMVSLKKSSPNTKFANILTYDQHNTPSGYIQIMYSLQKLATDFFSLKEVKSEMSEVFSGYEIDFTYSIKNAKTGKYDINSRKLTPLEHQQIALSLKLKTPVQWEEGAVYKRIEPILDFNYIGIVTATPQKKMVNDFFKSTAKIVVYLVILFVFVLLLAQLFYVRPVKIISKQLQHIANNNLEYRCQLNTGDEFEELADSFNEMAKDIAQKEQLEKFVSKDVLADMENMGKEDLKPGGDLIEATILFCEIDNFESFSEEQEANQVIELLNQFVSIVSKICGANHGVIDKIVEGSLMVVFKKGNHAINACKSALEISLTLKKITADRFSCHSGISTGRLISGKIGSHTGKLDFTVIGDTVNMAARLKSIHKLGKSTYILVSMATEKAIGEYANCSNLGDIEIKGKKQKQPIFEIIELI